MEKSISKFAFTAILAVAMAFTFSCSDDKNEGDNDNDIANYRTKKIGNQVWMAQNLNYNVSGSKCYNNDESNCQKYGRLYDWATAMALPASCNGRSCYSQINAKHKGICPSGWHIPSDDDWAELIITVGGSLTAGKELKATNDWNEDGNGSDHYGFSALPGGRGNEGKFIEIGDRGYWWSSSEHKNNNADCLTIYYDDDSSDWGNDDKQPNLFSVRCLQD